MKPFDMMMEEEEERAALCRLIRQRQIEREENRAGTEFVGGLLVGLLVLALAVSLWATVMILLAPTP